MQTDRRKFLRVSAQFAVEVQSRSGGAPFEGLTVNMSAGGAKMVPDALTVMMRPVQEDPDRVIAVGGTVRVANSSRVEAGRVVEPRMPAGHLAGFQVVEYLRAFLYGRVAWDALGALFIVSGAFGLFRRDVVEEVGGYWVDTVGEDLELTVRLHRHMREQGGPTESRSRPTPSAGRRPPPTSRRSEASAAAGTAACGSRSGGTAR